MGQNAVQEGWFAIFRVTATVRAHTIKYDCLCHIYWIADLFAVKFDWIVHIHKLECLVQNLDCCFQG